MRRVSAIEVDRRPIDRRVFPLGVGLVSILAGGVLVWAANGATKKEISFLTHDGIEKELSSSSA